MRTLSKYPWQAPVFAVVTLYGIYQYGWSDWRVITMYVITAVFVYFNFLQRRKKRLN
ncbi:MAG: hypothetical protein WCV90_00850 [Candidatus Woesearchaeota archaeon]